MTKPSLYRTYSSKDDLITSCLREHAEEGRARFEAAVAKDPHNLRAQLSNVLHAFAELAANQEFRGCPVSNASVEFPDRDHPMHQLSRQLKQEQRQRLFSVVSALGVGNPEGLTDGLILLFEGTSSASQSFGCSGPGCALVAAGEALIDSHIRHAATS